MPKSKRIFVRITVGALSNLSNDLDLDLDLPSIFHATEDLDPDLPSIFHATEDLDLDLPSSFHVIEYSLLMSHNSIKYMLL